MKRILYFLLLLSTTCLAQNKITVKAGATFPNGTATNQALHWNGTSYAPRQTSYLELANLPALSNGQVGVGNGSTIVGYPGFTYLNNLLKIISGTQGNFTAYPFQSFVMEKNGDAKLAVISSSNDSVTAKNAFLGTSFETIYSRLALTNGLYPGFEMQHVWGGSSKSLQYLRWNFFQAAADGTTNMSPDSNLIQLYGDGKLRVRSLRTNGTAPQTSGTVKTVLVDTSGQFSFGDGSGGGSSISGTLGYFPYYNSASSLAGTSPAYTDGTNIGIGIANFAPFSQLHVGTNGTLASRGIALSQHNTGANGALFNFYKSRGTVSAPTTVANGDYTGVFFANNYDGAAYRANGGFGFRVNGTVSSNSIPTDIFFYTNQASDQDPYTNNTVRLQIKSNGNIQLGGTTDNGFKLDVTGTQRNTGIARWDAGWNLHGTTPTNGQYPVYNSTTLQMDWATPAGGTTTNALTFNNSGTGDASGGTFNGSAAKTISYNSVGANPLNTPVNTGLLFGTTTAGIFGSTNNLTYDGTGNLNLSNGKVTLNPLNTATGTTGNQTINRASGTVNIAAGGTSVTVTNSFVSATSIVMPVIRTNDANVISIKSVVPGSGSFTINLTAAPAAEVSIGFMVINN